MKDIKELVEKGKLGVKRAVKITDNKRRGNMVCSACGYSYGLTGDDSYLFNNGHTIHCPKCKATLKKDS